MTDFASVDLTTASPLERRLKVGISLLFFSPRLTGAGVFVQGSVRLLLSRAANDYTLFVSEGMLPYWTDALGSGPHSFAVGGPEPAHGIRRVLYERYALGREARGRGLDVVFFPHTLTPQWHSPVSITTVYDLLLLSQEADYSVPKRLYHRLMYRTLRRSRNQIVTISEFCKADIAKRLRITPNRVTVATVGVDGEFRNNGHACPSVALPPSYLLSVGAAFPHKRLEMIIEVFEELVREGADLNLVLAGLNAGRASALKHLVERVQSSEFAGRIHLMPKLPRADLPGLYSGAKAFVSASVFEGFGIPVVEAMASGCPVAASPADAVRETTGGCAFLGRDFSRGALTDAVRHALTARQLEPELLRRARQRAAEYSWSATAASLEDAFSAAYSRSQRRVHTQYTSDPGVQAAL